MALEEHNPLEEPIAYLDPEDPEDRDILDNLDGIAKEIRDAYPTPMDAVDDYRKGSVDSAWLLGGFSEEEMEAIREEAGRRNEAEK